MERIMADLAVIGFKADTSGITKAEKGLDDLAKQGSKTERSLDSSSSKMSKSFGMVAGAVATVASAISSLNKIVAVTREFDILNAGLITATGSAERADEAFKAIQEFATSTPYSLAQATKAFNQLVNLGLTPSEKALRSYGNTAAAMGKDLSQMVEAVADAATGEFERLKEFGIKASAQGDKVSFTFRGVTKTIGNSAAEIEGYLMSLGNNEFAGAMTNRMQTLDGAISNLADSWDALFLTVSKQGAGGVIETSVRTATDALNELTAAIASGQLEGYLDAIISKFTMFGREVAGVLDNTGQLFSQAAEFWYLDMSESARLIIDAFKDMPENIRALLQTITVEVAAYVDRMTVYGKMVADSLNPFSDGFDPSVELANINAARQQSIQNIMNERQASLDSFTSQIQAADQLRKAYDENAASIDSNTDRLEKFGKTAEAVGKIGAKAFKDMDAAMEDHFQGLEDLDSLERERIARSETAMDAMFSGEENDYLNDLIGKVNDFGGAWSNTGSIIADAMGTASDAIADFGLRMESITKLQGQLAGQRALYADESEEALKIDAALAQLNQQASTAQLKAISSIMGASSSLFKQNSKERKALHAMEMGFAAAEMAINAQKAITSAVAAVANQGSGDPYTAFGRIAAMVGIMGGVLAAAGIAFNGGGGSSYTAPSAGTGTTLGETGTSNSVSAALDMYKDISLDQLAELRAINDSMNSLANGIAGLTVSLIRSSGITGASVEGLGKTSKFGAPDFMNRIGDKMSGIDPLIGVFDGILNSVLGGISKTSKSLLDSGIVFNSQAIGEVMATGMLDASYFAIVETTKKKLWGLSKKTSTSTEESAIESALLGEFGKVFGYLGDSVTAALDSLGIEAANAVGSFMINIGNISFKDMTGDQIQKELEAIFSQQGDLLAQYVLPQITEYQRLGEGAFETLQRVAKEQAVFMDAIERTGHSLAGLSNLMQVDVAQSIITMMGGLDNFTKATSEYFSSFYTEQEQLASLQASLSDVFGTLNTTMPTTREGFRALVDSLDLTTEAGQQMFAVLMQLVPGMDQYLDALEQQQEAAEKAAAALAKQAQSLDLRLLEAQGRSTEALAMRRQMELDATDESLRGMLLAIYAAEDAAAAQRELASAQTQAAQTARSAAQSAFGKLQDAAQTEKDRISDELEMKLDAIDKERAALELQRDTVIDGYQQQAQAVSKYINELEGISSVINSFLADAGGAVDPFKRLGQIFNEVKGGLLPDQGELQSVLGAISTVGSSGFASAFEQQKALSVARNQAAGIGENISGRLSGARSQISLIQQQITDAEEYYAQQLAKLDLAAEQAQALHDEQIAEIDKQLSEAEKQLNALLGIDDRMLTMSEALNEFYSALSEAQKVQLTVDGAQIEAINAVEAAVIAVGQQIADSPVWVPPTMPDRAQETESGMTSEMVELLNNILAATKANADHSSKSASLLQEITIGGIDTRSIA